ncbi:MAG TPA: chemotaxis response regulator protein-glutamate methylesterase [bacterium]|nr:chemotaxis response regulator protein-glutamate methylesterase [bacterium]
MKKIRVLVVDDSAFMRKVITQMLEGDPEIEAAGTAKDGKDAIKKAAELKPDVITMDLEMPGLDGLKTLEYIMKETPTPVIMLSAYTPKGAETTLRALEAGAADFVCKPSGEVSLDIKKVKEELVEKIKTAAQIDARKLTVLSADIGTGTQEASGEGGRPPEVLVIIAASTGGPRALTEVIPRIQKRSLPASYIVIQHMSQGFTKTLAERLDSHSLIKIKEATDGEEIVRGNAYLAPGNYHLEIKREKARYYISLNQKPTRLGVRPCADITMISAAEEFMGPVVGVILTGMGKDGTAGAAVLREKKAVIVAQDRETSVIYGMPKSAAEKGMVDIIQPIDRIAEEIERQIEKAAGGA